MLRAIYRNLTEARRDLSVYVWSIVNLNGREKRTTLDRQASDGGHERGVMYAANITPVCNASKLAQIRRQARRTVAAYLVGDIVEHVDGHERRITLNPFTDDAFKFSDTGEIVDFSKLRGVKFTPSGALALI